MDSPNYPSNNPYIAGAPIKGEEMFFGRDDIFEKVRAHLVGEHQDNPIVICGQRRTGKTSVLYQMERRLNAREGRERYVAVLVDLQRFTLKGMDHFLLELADTIRRALRHTYKIPRPKRTAFQTDARQTFRDHFLPAVQSAIGERRLLLMFDEAGCFQEAVEQNHLGKDVFDYLRSVIQHEENVSFLFSLGSKIDSLPPEYKLMLNMALTLPVTFLDEAAARALITEPVGNLYSFEEDAIERLLALTSRHPYFTQVICHTLFTRWEQKRFTQVTSADVNAVLDDATNLTAVNFQHIWDESTPAQKLVLAAMAEMKVDPSINLHTLKLHLKQLDIDLAETDISSALKKLNQREVIDSPSQPRFYVRLVRHWLMREKPLTQTREELDEYLQQLSSIVERPSLTSNDDKIKTIKEFKTNNKDDIIGGISCIGMILLGLIFCGAQIELFSCFLLSYCNYIFFYIFDYVMTFIEICIGISIVVLFIWDKIKYGKFF